MKTKKLYKDYTFEETRELINQKGIKTRTEFSNKHYILYSFAVKNGWMDDLFPDSKASKKYESYTFEQIKEFIEKEGITSRTELKDRYNKIHQVACIREWINDLFPGSEKHLSKGYSTYTFEQIKEFIEKEGITSRTGFSNKSCALYNKAKDTYDEASGKSWLDILIPGRPEYCNFTFDETKDLIEREGITSISEFQKRFYALSKRARENDWLNVLFHNPQEYYTKATDITAFVKEFLTNWDEALHYPNVILMKLAESFGDTSLLNKLVKKIATTDPGSIERAELLKEMNEQMVERDDITCKEIEDIVKMSQGMEDNAVDDPITAMEKLMNIDDIEDKNGNISAESLGHQVDMAQRALNNKLIDDKNCGDIVLTIENVFLHRMLCLWADGDDNVTEKMFEKLFV